MLFPSVNLRAVAVAKAALYLLRALRPVRHCTGIVSRSYHYSLVFILGTSHCLLLPTRSLKEKEKVQSLRSPDLRMWHGKRTGLLSQLDIWGP